MSQTAVEQFVEDFLLVAENDQKTYDKLIELTNEYKNSPIHVLALEFQNWWEWRTHAIKRVCEKNDLKPHALFVAQMLNNWPLQAWIMIASHFLVTVHESDSLKESLQK